MRFGFPRWLVMVLIAGLCLPASAQWKWRDSTGRTQYSDLPPPPGTPDSSILLRPAAAPVRASSAAAAASVASLPLLPPAKTVEPELEKKLREEKEAKAAKAKLEEQKIAAQKADSCTRARNQLLGLNEGLRVASVNSKGEREVLDDKGRADETQRVKAIIKADCK
jgi:hypothetical protein